MSIQRKPRVKQILTHSPMIALPQPTATKAQVKPLSKQPNSLDAIKAIDHPSSMRGNRSKLVDTNNIQQQQGSSSASQTQISMQIHKLQKAASIQPQIAHNSCLVQTLSLENTMVKFNVMSKRQFAVQEQYAKLCQMFIPSLPSSKPIKQQNLLSPRQGLARNIHTNNLIALAFQSEHYMISNTEKKVFQFNKCVSDEEEEIVCPVVCFNGDDEPPVPVFNRFKGLF